MSPSLVQGKRRSEIAKRLGDYSRTWVEVRYQSSWPVGQLIGILKGTGGGKSLMRTATSTQ